jgi:hypothetical protein
MKYFDPAVMGATYAELAMQSDALMQGRYKPNNRLPWCGMASPAQCTGD